MAIKVKAKDEDTKEKELEEWSLGVNLFDASSDTPKVVKFDAGEVKKDQSKRTTYENEELTNSDL